MSDNINLLLAKMRELKALEDEIAELKSEIIAEFGADKTITADGGMVIIGDKWSIELDVAELEAKYPAKVKKARAGLAQSIRLTRANLADYMSGNEIESACKRKKCTPKIQVRLAK